MECDHCVTMSKSETEVSQRQGEKRSATSLQGQKISIAGVKASLSRCRQTVSLGEDIEDRRVGVRRNILEDMESGSAGRARKSSKEVIKASGRVPAADCKVERTIRPAGYMMTWKGLRDIGNKSE